MQVIGISIVACGAACFYNRRHPKTMICCKQHRYFHLSLAPGFSPVIKGRGTAEPLQRFCSLPETVETTSRVAAFLTGLKPGANKGRAIFVA
jgi:hypothetical protein